MPLLSVLPTEKSAQGSVHAPGPRAERRSRLASQTQEHYWSQTRPSSGRLLLPDRGRFLAFHTPYCTSKPPGSSRNTVEFNSFVKTDTKKDTKNKTLQRRELLIKLRRYFEVLSSLFFGFSFDFLLLKMIFFFNRRGSQAGNCGSPAHTGVRFVDTSPLFP